MINEFRISVVRKGYHGQEFGFGRQCASSGLLWSFSQTISISPGLTDFDMFVVVCGGALVVLYPLHALCACISI
jgi:hypothetical protein